MRSTANHLTVEELRTLSDDSNFSLQAISGEARQFRHQFEKRGLSEVRRKQLSIIGERLCVIGFVPVNGVPSPLRIAVVDPVYFEQAPRVFCITGMNSGQKGSTKFRCVNLFGVRILRESYYVMDWTKFSKFISTRLELMFRATNPAASRYMRTAFTRFMHNFGLHWTGCHHFVS